MGNILSQWSHGPVWIPILVKISYFVFGGKIIPVQNNLRVTK